MNQPSSNHDFTSSGNNLPRTTNRTSIRQGREANVAISRDCNTTCVERNARADSDPPPSYSATTNHPLCYEEGSETQNLSSSSHSLLIDSNDSDLRPFACTPDHSNLGSSAPRCSFSSPIDATKPTATKYQSPTHAYQSDHSYPQSSSYKAANLKPSEDFKSKGAGYQMCNPFSSEQCTGDVTSRLAPRTMAPSSSPAATTTSDSSARKTREEIQKLINSTPELRDNMYDLIATTVASVEAQQPSDIRAKDIKIEQLQAQLLEALNYGNDKARKIEELEASVKVAADTGLSQIETLEELHNKLKGQEETEKNLRRGNMALTKQLDPLKAENAKLKRQLKDAEKEIDHLKQKYEYQTETLGLLSQKARQTERMNMRFEDDLTKLERENKLLVLKGEQMSGKLLAVAEQWHGPSLSGRKRQAEEVLEDGERERRFARMTR